MSKTNLCLAILALSIAIGFAATARAEKRIALLVGNNAYQNVPRLQTAVNDARAVGTALRGLGFSVIIAENQSRRAMSEALLAFDKAIEPGDIALFFFAGHGFEIRGQNYLLPTDIPEVREGQEELIRDSAFVAKESRSPARIKCGGMLFRITLHSIDESIHVEEKLLPRDPRAEHRDRLRRDRSRGEAHCPAGRQ